MRGSQKLLSLPGSLPNDGIICPRMRPVSVTLFLCVHCCSAAAAGGKAAKAAAKSAAKQDKRNAKLKEQRAAEAAAGTKRKASELQVGP